MLSLPHLQPSFCSSSLDAYRFPPSHWRLTHKFCQVLPPSSIQYFLRNKPEWAGPLSTMTRLRRLESAITPLTELNGAQAIENASPAAPVFKRGGATGNTIGQWNQIASSVQVGLVNTGTVGNPR